MRRVPIFSILALTVFGTGLTWLFLIRGSKPSFGLISDGNNRDPVIAFLNPFRSRAGERISAGILSSLSKGEVDTALSQFGDNGGEKDRIRTGEIKFKIASWSLRRILVDSREVSYLYRVHRTNSGDGSVWIVYSITDQGGLVPLRFEDAY